MKLHITGLGCASRLIVTAPTAASLEDFEGTASEAAGGVVLEGPLSSANAAAARGALPMLRPRPIGLRTSAGVGDRLGLATPGHARAFSTFGDGVVPVFAQQSIREMERLDRNPRQVLDDATFGLVRAGWQLPIGADADHVKSVGDLQRCLEAGFTMFTLDPGAHVQRVADDSAVTRLLANLPWQELEDDLDSMLRRYAGFRLDLGDQALNVSPEDVRRAAAKYGAAVAHAAHMYRYLMANADVPVEVEVSVDETDEVTSLAEHVYLGIEMKRLGMTWVSFAPRYVGDFEKGVEYRHDPTVLFSSLGHHARIAQEIGPYKLSLHSGSDKFSIYELAVKATHGLVHLKTSGTSYLVALDVAARWAPDLFREMYAVSRNAYGGARASYQVSARMDRTPPPVVLPDDRLCEVMTSRDSRQMMHVGYGAVLRTKDGHSDSQLALALRGVLEDHADAYNRALTAHIGRHLRPFSAQGERTVPDYAQ